MPQINAAEVSVRLCQGVIGYWNGAEEEQGKIMLTQG